MKGKVRIKGKVRLTLSFYWLRVSHLGSLFLLAITWARSGPLNCGHLAVDLWMEESPRQKYFIEF